MKQEEFDAEEIRAISAAMRVFAARCEAIMTILGEKPKLTPYERSEVTTFYSSLKNDLKAAAKYGTLSGRREPLNRAEQCFYDPAVRRAAVDLRPATNSNPISSRWFSAVFEAQSEFSYYLHNLKGLPGSEEDS